MVRKIIVVGIRHYEDPFYKYVLILCKINATVPCICISVEYEFCVLISNFPHIVFPLSVGM